MQGNTIFKNAPLVAVTVLVTVTVMLFVMDNPVKKTGGQQQVSVPAVNNPPPTANVTDNVAANATPAQTGQAGESAPAEENSGAAAAPMLQNLIKGLEQKVAADPANTGNKMLLAQTYAEVGEIEKGVSMLREIQAAEPDNVRLSIVMASVLGKSNNPEELKQAMTLLNAIDPAGDPNIAGSVLLQRGRLYIKMGETESARKEWQQALTSLPPGSGYRKQVEIELARLN